MSKAKIQKILPPTPEVEGIGDSSNLLEVLDAPAQVRPSTGLRTRRTNSELFVQEKAAAALAKRHSEREAIILQQVLPLWDDEHRGVPNPMIRSGLFGTKSGTHRLFVKGDKIASLSNFTIHYKGEELLQDDLSVWMALINMAREKRIGDAIFFSGYELVKDLGWRMHSESYTRAKESISRLKANELKIQVKTESAGYAGSLIREYAWSAPTPEGGTAWMVRFEPMIAELFRDEMVTFVEWEQRKMIGPRDKLSLWLHAFYMSHREPLPISIQKLHELCKSEEKHIKSFKARIRNSLEKLVKVGLLSSYQIVNDTVHVKRTPLRFSSNLKAAATKRLN